MGTAFRVGWILFALSVVVGIVAAVTTSGDLRAASMFSDEATARSPYVYYLFFPGGLALILLLGGAAARGKPASKFRDAVVIGTAAVMLLTQVGNVANQLDMDFITLGPLQRICFLAGVLLVIAGNYLPKAAREDSLNLPRPWSFFFSIPWTLPFAYLFGVRTWWTLASERVWNRTHRLAERLWIVSGVTLAVAAWVTDANVLKIAIAASLVLNIVTPVLYSFAIRKDHAAA